MKDFSLKLTNWYSTNKRTLPWRESQNPYKIWLSEIILQQTRVAQGTAYYYRFIDQFPTPNQLADAPLDEILKLWQGLGYYSRARNLHKAALHIKNEFKGTFPSTYKDILALNGVGEYTAAAIASFAYDLPYAVVDGNVYRVLSRIFGITTPIDSTLGKKEFKQLAQELLDKKDPATHNQAIMEYGALHCTPKTPKCSSCVFNDQCYAFSNNQVDVFPIKEKKIKKTTRYFYYIHIEHNQVLYIQKREDKDIWQNLYQLPLIESKKRLSENDLIKQTLNQIGTTKSDTIKGISKEYKHLLSHQTIYAKFIKITPHKNTNISSINPSWIEVPKHEFDTFAVPRLIEKYFEEI